MGVQSCNQKFDKFSVFRKDINEFIMVILVYIAELMCYVQLTSAFTLYQ